MTRGIVVGEDDPTMPLIPMCDDSRPHTDVVFARIAGNPKRVRTVLEYEGPDMGTGKPGKPYEVVPAGYESDGASIPWWLWWLIGHPLTPPFWGAALVHDFRYGHHTVSRKQADDDFREHLRIDGAGRVRAWVMWAAVRAFGWMHW